MVETLSEEVESSRYVRWVRGLEEKMSEGRFRGGYYEAKEGIPPCDTKDSGWVKKSDFEWLTSQLIEGMRSEIASCASKAYPTSTLSLKDASTLMFFSKSEEAEILKLSERMEWQIDPSTGLIRWGTEENDEGGGRKKDDELKKEDVVIEMLGYAKELESIV